MTTIVEKLSVDFPNFQFIPGDSFFWSAKDNLIQYSKDQLHDSEGIWSILHELGHAILDHRNYSSDIELIILEREAWDRACKLAKGYNIIINQNHIENCMDTYREWLHQRSKCPKCSVHSLQQNNLTYSCYNCSQKWTVTSSRFCRPYRLKLK